MTPLHKLPKNVRNLGKLIVAKGLKKLPKVQKIAQSGHTDLKHQRQFNEQLYNSEIRQFNDCSSHVTDLRQLHCFI